MLKWADSWLMMGVRWEHCSQSLAIFVRHDKASQNPIVFPSKLGYDRQAENSA